MSVSGGEGAANDLAVLTPYLVSPRRKRKIVNVGDGIILRGVERLIGRFDPARMFATRDAPDAGARRTLEASTGVIVAGGNQLADNYTVWPGLTAAELRGGSLRFIPFGVGHSGRVKYNRSLSTATREILKAIHERIEFSSWRCPRTVAILHADLPELKGRLLMTGCPAIYDAPLLEGASFVASEDHVAVTVTDRKDFWERETSILREIADLFPKAQRTVVFHQDFPVAEGFAGLVGHLPVLGRFASAERARLRNFARSLGYELFVPASVDDCLDFYDRVDLHVGSRLHAHLYFISQNKWSFLVAVDGRAAGFADFLGFPLCEPGAVEGHLGFDFEIVRRAARETFVTMRRFVASLRP